MSTIIDNILNSTTQPRKQINSNKETNTTPEYTIIKKTPNDIWDAPNKPLTYNSSEKDVSEVKPTWEEETAPVIYDEIPSDEELTRQDASHTIDKLLLPWTKRKQAIQDYILKHNLETIPADVFTKKQTYRVGDKQYILTEEICNNITQMDMDMSAHNKVEHTLKNQTNTLQESLSEILNKTEFNFPLSENLTTSQITKIILKVLSFNLNYKLISKHETKFTFNRNTLSSVLGDSIFSAILLVKYIYIPSEEAEILALTDPSLIEKESKKQLRNIKNEVLKG